ncbi:uncharacterized protein LOC126905340 [Daktulosphaira vitifoliae]|uniref:uncharacterized protein LOC126905340 n=1 Tax=Daktulosphaira vitifoliae TaxID=58002 RepID=UPI0021AADE3F|nr:uncharacterized protein LOC126905340 [Daktulosphaira vitifoliae]
MSIDNLTLQLCDIQDESWEVEDSMNNLNHDYQNVHEVIDMSAKVVNFDELLNCNENIVSKNESLKLSSKNCLRNIHLSSHINEDSKTKKKFSNYKVNELDFNYRNNTISYDMDCHNLKESEINCLNNTEISYIKKEFEVTSIDKNNLKNNRTHVKNDLDGHSENPITEVKEQENMCNSIKVKIEGNSEFYCIGNKLYELEKMETESMLESNSKSKYSFYKNGVESDDFLGIKHEFDKKSIEQTKEELTQENIEKCIIDENLYFQEEPDIVDPDIMYNIDLDQHFRKMDFLLQQISNTPDDLRVLDECMQLPPIPQIEFSTKVFTEKERSAFNEGISEWEYEIDRENWNKIMVKRAAVFTAHAGFDLSSEESLYVIADIATDYIKKLAGIMKKHFDSQINNSTFNLFNPIERSLCEVGVKGGVVELIQHYRNDIFGRRNRLLIKCNYYQVIIDQFIKKKLIDTGVDVENIPGDNLDVKRITNETEVRNNNLFLEKLSFECMKKPNEIIHNSSFEKLGVMNNTDLESMDMSNNMNTSETGNKFCNIYKPISLIKHETNTDILNKNLFDSKGVFKILNVTKNNLKKSEGTKDNDEQMYFVKHDDQFDILDSNIDYCQKQLNLLEWGVKEFENCNSDYSDEDDINKCKDNLYLNQGDNRSYKIDDKVNDDLSTQSIDSKSIKNISQCEKNDIQEPTISYSKNTSLCNINSFNTNYSNVTNFVNDCNTKSSNEPSFQSLNNEIQMVTTYNPRLSDFKLEVENCTSNFQAVVQKTNSEISVIIDQQKKIISNSPINILNSDISIQTNELG